jgi:hypothetical protein
MRRFSRRPGAEYCPEARHEAERFLHWRRKNRPLPKGFLAQLTSRRLKRGVFVSVVDLQAAINRFVDEHNRAPKPFSWTADPDAVIAAVKHRHQALIPSTSIWRSLCSLFMTDCRKCDLM